MLTHLIYTPEKSADKEPSSNTQSKLIEATDRILEEAQYLSRDSIPGGSISFLFERSTRAVAKDDDDDEE